MTTDTNSPPHTLQEESTDVYLIEDDVLVQQANVQSLELEGLAVQAFGDAESALKQIHGRIHGVVVSDVRLPGADGLQLLQQVKDIDPAIPVILISGHADVPLAVRAMRMGACDFIEKPFLPPRLVGSVLKALAARRAHLQQSQVAATSDLSILTEREQEIAKWVGLGKSNAEIAAIAGISEGTVKRHLTHVFDKLGLRSRAQLVRCLMEKPT